MNADQIVHALQGKPSIERLHELQRECNTRRQEITRREADICDPPPPFAKGPARKVAIATGLEACRALDVEGERIARERAYLDDVEQLAVVALESARVAAVRAAVPGARKRLRSATADIRNALAALDRAIAQAGEALAPIAEVCALPGEDFQMTDDELSELLTLRDEVWRTRTVPSLLPPATHPRSLALLFEERPDGTIIRRPAPSRVYLPDIGRPTYV